MKITRLRFKNLNSLKGEFLIDFSAPPLGDAGLFAVTGSTGAGKSTIFDALCLGLYGETPRLRKRRSGGDGIFEIVSRHTAEAYTEVDFEINGERYRSAWEAHRARGSVEGQFQAPRMYLLALEGDAGTLLEEKLSEVPSRVAELTGLDFERFTRSVLLAQGAFAAFLQAEPAERADLLEKMTGSDLYSEISRLSFERAKEEQRRFDELKQRKNALELLDEEELSELERAKGEAETLFADLQTKRDSLIASIEKARRIRRSAEVLQQQKEELNKLENQRPRMEDIRISLSAHDRALPVEPLLKSRDDKSREREGMEERLSSRRAAVVQLQNREAEAREAEAEAAILRNKAEEAKSSALDIRVEAERLGSELTYRRSSLDEKRNEIKRDRDSLETLGAQVVEAKEIGHALEQERKAAAALLSSEAVARLERKAELLRHHFAVYKRSRTALLPLKAQSDELSRSLGAEVAPPAIEWDELSGLEEQLRNWDDLARHASRKEELTSSLLEREGTLQELKNEIEELESSLIEERANLARADEAERRDAALALRETLRRGVPCPVCGSKEHSWRGEQELFPESSVAPIPAEEFKSRIRRKELHQAELTERVKGLETAQTAGKTELQRIEAILAESTFSFAAHAKLRLQVEESRRCWDAAEKLKPLRLELARLKREEEDAREALEELLTDTGISLAEDDPVGKAEALISRYSRAREEEQRRKESERELEREDARLRAKRDELEERLADNLDRLQELEAYLSKGAARLKELTGGVSFEEFLAWRTKALEEAERIQRERKDILAGIREELAGERSAIEATLSLTEEADRRLDELEQELHRQVEEAGFDGVPALRAAFRGDAGELRLKLRSFEEREGELTRRIEELSRELEEAPEDLRDLEALEARLAALIAEYDTALARRQELSSQLMQERSRRLEAEGLQRKIEAQRSELDLWQRLKELIGSATGDSFRRFAQGLTLEYLIRLANRHLIRFSGRYRLRREEGSELRMEIIDTWQADAVRPVGTLSGGETFLASLALALGLSELAGRKTRIDSLFLDEGFGSLDGETLETVIAALESLQSGGKLIGIISHVEALKERIPVQIRVQRHGTGYSRLELVP